MQDNIIFTVELNTNLSDSTVNIIIEKLQGVFKAKNLFISKARSWSGSTIVELTVQFISDNPKTALTLGGIGIYVLEKFAGEFIKKTANEIFEGIRKIGKKKKENKISDIQEALQMISNNPSVVLPQQNPSDPPFIEIIDIFKPVTPETESITIKIRKDSIDEHIYEHIDVFYRIDQRSKIEEFKVDYKRGVS